MKLKIVLFMLLFVAGCKTFGNNDPRPPLMNNSSFVDYKPSCQ